MELNSVSNLPSNPKHKLLHSSERALRHILLDSPFAEVVTVVLFTTHWKKQDRGSTVHAKLLENCLAKLKVEDAKEQ